MNISDLLIPELKHETQLNETFLKRVPEDKLSWAPHEKSTKMGVLCAHIVELYGYVPAVMNQDGVDMAGYTPPKIVPIGTLLEQLNELAPAAEEALNKDNQHYEQPWAMRRGDEVMMEASRYMVLRSTVLNQFPHHRAQLGVYLRLLDVDVPATYGPSADEA